MSRAAWVLLALLCAACGGADPGGDQVPAPDVQPSAEVPAPVVQPPDAGPAEPLPPLPPAGALPPVQEAVPTVELRIAPADLARLDADPLSDATVPCVMVLGGLSAPGQVRYRGASTRTLPQKSFKVELDPGHELERRDHFELLAQYTDAAKLTEVLAVHLFTALGAPVPRVRYVELRLNGEPNGLYVDMEHVGGEYLRDHGLERDASIYRAGARNGELTLQPGPGGYQADFEKKSNEDTPSTDLAELLHFLNRSDDDAFEAGLPARLDVDGYVLNLVGDALISNNLVEDARGYWVHELARDRWSYVPWDLNNALMFQYRDEPLGTPLLSIREAEVFSVYDPGVEDLYLYRLQQNPAQRPTWSVLATRLWDRPALRERLLERLAWALDTVFTEEKVGAHVDALYARIAPALQADPFVAQASAASAPGVLKQYVRERRAFLRRELLRLAGHGGGSLVINELAVGPGGYVELYARGDADVPVGGRVLTNDLRSPLAYRLPAGLVVPAHGFLRLWASGDTSRGREHLPFTLGSAGGELGLFDGTHVGLPLDVVYFGPREAGSAYGRLPDGSEHLRGLSAQTPGTANR